MWRIVATTLLLLAAAGAARAGEAPAPAPVPPAGAPAAAAVPQSADAYRAAAADVEAVDVGQQPYTRYLWLSEEDSFLDTDRRSLSYHLNHLSRESEVVPLYEPKYLTAGGRLARVNLQDLGIDPAVWEKLAGVDPFFHAPFVEEEEEYVDQEYGHYEDSFGHRVSEEQGKAHPDRATWVKTHTEREKTGRKIARKVAALAFWDYARPGGVIAANQSSVPAPDGHGTVPVLLVTDSREQEAARGTLASLVSQTHSAVPVVDGRWFVFQTAIDLDRAPGYHDFLEFNNRTEFEALVGFDAKALKKFPQELAEAVRLSDVAKGRKPRAVVRKGKIGGGLWYTLDVEVPTDKNSPLRIFDPDRNLVATAIEAIGNLPNGLDATGLFKFEDGSRQDTAPQGIALDRWGGANDFNVHEGDLSCARCHSLHSGKDGLADIKPFVRGHVNREPLELRAADGASRERFRRIYTRDLQADLEDDRRLIARATLKATGWPTKKAVEAFADLWDRYTDTPVDAERAARDVGLGKAEFLRRLRLFTKATGSIDPALSAYLRPDAVRKGKEILESSYLEDDGPLPLQVDVYHELVPLMQFAVRGLVPITPVESNGKVRVKE